MTTAVTGIQNGPSNWLRNYAYARFAFSAVWVLAAFTLATGSPAIAGALLVVYPAWDALANVVDARRSGGLAGNRTQMFNIVISALTTLAVIVALTQSMAGVVAVFGVWAVLSGILQLATGLRRWSAGGQWAMVLSGAQSALAGGFFVVSANTMNNPDITLIAPYAAFGAFYFLVSAIWLTVKDAGGNRAA
ncbi:hypothetical protein DMC47_03785 [Nostoc sp. 3335mG]|nr:hypothetical protein DMC47_03785 [Nostoc sp. 3335mG]